MNICNAMLPKTTDNSSHFVEGRFHWVHPWPELSGLKHWEGVAGKGKRDKRAGMLGTREIES